jgi:hypothetical protein
MAAAHQLAFPLQPNYSGPQYASYWSEDPSQFLQDQKGSSGKKIWGNTYYFARCILLYFIINIIIIRGVRQST